MPRFVFRLAPVLRHRERIEEEKKLLLAAAQRKLFEAESERQRLRNRREELATELVAEHRKIDGETLRMTYAHLDFLAREITAADWRVAAATQAVDLARDYLVRATKDRKVLERLRERQLEAFNVEQLRLEQRDLDEANSRRHARVVREGVSP
ncbi:MAG: flagellar export protein FliJ [Candidatus Eremiobacteraeota bacterium]|nr:flagellar export protein FliJ [Candidatus Eremiobacteraeota bacterium]